MKEPHKILKGVEIKQKTILTTRIKTMMIHTVDILVSIEPKIETRAAVSTRLEKTATLSTKLEKTATLSTNINTTTPIKVPKIGTKKIDNKRKSIRIEIQDIIQFNRLEKILGITKNPHLEAQTENINKDIKTKGSVLSTTTFRSPRSKPADPTKKRAEVTKTIITAYTEEQVIATTVFPKLNTLGTSMDTTQKINLVNTPTQQENRNKNHYSQSVDLDQPNTKHIDIDIIHKHIPEYDFSRK